MRRSTGARNIASACGVTTCHYFAWLKSAVSAECKAALIDDWIARNPQGSEPAWEPYTASLRIVNWVQYFSGDEVEPTSAWLASLYEQCLWLEKNLELHILANHYFENLKALLFAGCYFSGDDAARWRALALPAFAAELEEQFLADGGHYERSPQYHAILLEACLDVYQLARSQPAQFPAPLVNKLASTVANGLAFLADISGPQQRLPLFNDSAFGIAPALGQLQDYAHQLGLVAAPVVNESTAGGIDRARLIDKPDSGLYGYRCGDDWLLVDCGDIGPAYQPGHTHCDFLSYELVVAGQPLVVDTGVLEYEPGAMRHYVRSTAAHNTVQVDGAEQSEIWGEFRVARRARKQFARVQQGQGQWRFSGAFRGFPALGWLQHQRDMTVQLASDGAIRELQFCDTVTGRGERQLRSYIHLHPDIHVLGGGGEWQLYRGKQLLAWLAVGNNTFVHVQPTLWCPEFGQPLQRSTVILERAAALPQTLQYTLTILD